MWKEHQKLKTVNNCMRALRYTSGSFWNFRYHHCNFILDMKKKIPTSLRSLASKERKNMMVKKNLRVTTNFYKQCKTFIEVSCSNNIHTAENLFYSCYF